MAGATCERSIPLPAIACGFGLNELNCHKMGKLFRERCSVYELSADKDLGTHVLHTKLESDDHNAPAFYVRPDGRILAAYAYHTSPAHYHRISEPDDPTRWGPEQSFKHPHDISYMNLFITPTTM